MGPKLNDMGRRLHALEERVGDVEDGLARTRRVLDRVTTRCNALIQASAAGSTRWERSAEIAIACKARATITRPPLVDCDGAKAASSTAWA